MKGILLNTNYAEVYVETDIRLGVIIWKSNCNEDEYKKAFLTLLDFHKKENLPYYLSDIQNQGIVNPQNRKWFENYALPMAAQNGLKKAAVITNSHPFKRYYINMLLKVVKRTSVI